MMKILVMLCYLFYVGGCGDNRGDRTLSVEPVNVYQCTARFVVSERAYTLYLEDDSQERWFFCSQHVVSHQRGVGYQQPRWHKRYDEVTTDVFSCRLALYGVADGELFADVSYNRKAETASYQVIDQDSNLVANGEFICEAKL